VTIYLITCSELRSKAAEITRALRSGDSFVLMYYRQPVGYITPKVPKKLLKDAGLKRRGIKAV